MPRLSDSMEEGTIVSWLSADGDEIARGEPLAEIETDKATMTYEADAAGFLHLVAEEGDTLPVGAVIAQLLSGAGELSTTDGPTSGSDATSPSSASGGPDAYLPRGDMNRGSVSASSTRVKASPLARRLARQHEIDISTVAGSGRGGRVTKADVEAAADGPVRSATAVATVADDAPSTPREPALPAPAAEPVTSARGAVEVVDLSRTQALIARRMAEAKATVPEFTVAVDVDAEALFALRAELRALTSPLPSVNDFIVKAVALALLDHPRANGSYRDGRFHLHSRVNVGVAVASGGTLLVPTVFDADVRPIGEIAIETRALVERARSGAITPGELAGGTFTVSNLGMFGVSRFTAVINTPQAGILAVGAAIPRAVTGEDGQLYARRVIEMTLSADHRILYGADAAAFLVSVRKLLEQPLRLLV